MKTNAWISIFFVMFLSFVACGGEDSQVEVLEPQITVLSSTSTVYLGGGDLIGQFKVTEYGGQNVTLSLVTDLPETDIQKYVVLVYSNENSDSYELGSSEKVFDIKVPLGVSEFEVVIGVFLNYKEVDPEETDKVGFINAILAIRAKAFGTKVEVKIPRLWLRTYEATESMDVFPGQNVFCYRLGLVFNFPARIFEIINLVYVPTIMVEQDSINDFLTGAYFVYNSENYVTSLTDGELSSEFKLSLLPSIGLEEVEEFVFETFLKTDAEYVGESYFSTQLQDMTLALDSETAILTKIQLILSGEPVAGPFFISSETEPKTVMSISVHKIPSVSILPPSNSPLQNF